MNNSFPTKDLVELLKKQYHAGARVELVCMDDPQAPPIGTKGTVTTVDDIGTVHVNWDNGSSLGLVYGQDSFRKLSATIERREDD